MKKKLLFLAFLGMMAAGSSAVFGAQDYQPNVEEGRRIATDVVNRFAKKKAMADRMMKEIRRLRTQIENMQSNIDDTQGALRCREEALNGLSNQLQDVSPTRELGQDQSGDQQRTDKVKKLIDAVDGFNVSLQEFGIPEDFDGDFVDQATARLQAALNAKKAKEEQDKGKIRRLTGLYNQIKKQKDAAEELASQRQANLDQKTQEIQSLQEMISGLNHDLEQRNAYIQDLEAKLLKYKQLEELLPYLDQETQDGELNEDLREFMDQY